MEYEDLSENQKVDYRAGYLAARRGGPFLEYQTVEWMIGFRDFWKDKLEAQTRRLLCMAH